MLTSQKTRGKNLMEVKENGRKKKLKKNSNSFYKASITLLIKKKKLTSTLEKRKILN